MSAPVDVEKNETDAEPAAPKKLEVEEVIIHPLVLLSAADHYHRVARGTRKRVVGVLLGQVFHGKVDATNSFAVPFEEDSKNPAVFYLDHNYLESMLTMFRKINAKERVVGFYSTGPQIRPNDLRIHDIVERFTGSFNSKTAAVATKMYPAVFSIIDIRPDRPDLPVTSYKVVEEPSSTSGVRRTFSHVASSMGAMEAEEVGVEHLLRDVHDPTVSTVASLVGAKLQGLRTLQEKLLECKDYLEMCARGECQPNPEIVANLQTILSLLPNLNTETLVRSMMVKTNDMQMAIYLSSLIRTVIALHDLIDNKIQYGEGAEEEEEKKESDEAAAAVVAAKKKEVAKKAEPKDK